jgi:hypothetical protein
MTRRRVFFGLLLASAVLACFAGWLLTTSGPRLTRERFEQVKNGMSREEVIRTVGGPPGNDNSGGGYMNNLHYAEQWSADDGLLLVQFDDAGTVTDMLVLRRSPPTLIERIRRWLGL